MIAYCVVLHSNLFAEQYILRIVPHQCLPNCLIVFSGFVAIYWMFGFYYNFLNQFCIDGQISCFQTLL